MKTLADMTPEERAECVGMWADFEHDNETGLKVITRVTDSGVELLSPANRWEYVGGPSWMSKITPRFDLPRAWMPDGAPWEGEWSEWEEPDGDWREWTSRIEAAKGR